MRDKIGIFIIFTFDKQNSTKVLYIAANLDHTFD
jgi:hypothetical protein